MTGHQPAEPTPRGTPSGHAPGRLKAARRRHLVSAYSTASHLLRQMEEAGREGRSPSGVGAPLTPLPPERLESILAPLRNLKVRLRAAAADLAPQELAALETVQGPRSTLNWMSNLLDHVRVAVDNLQARRMAKYGAVAPEEAQALDAMHAALAACVAAAREALDRDVRPD
jgi:hypothetical protein